MQQAETQDSRHGGKFGREEGALVKQDEKCLGKKKFSFTGNEFPTIPGECQKIQLYFIQ